MVRMVLVIVMVMVVVVISKPGWHSYLYAYQLRAQLVL